MDDHDNAPRDAEHEPSVTQSKTEHGFRTADDAATAHAAFFDLPLTLTPEERRAATPISIP